MSWYRLSTAEEHLDHTMQLKPGESVSPLGSRDSTRAIRVPFTIITLRFHQLGQKVECILRYLSRWD